MIVQGILSFLLLLFFYAFGILFKKIFPKIPELKSFYLLGGILMVSFIGTISAFFIPLNLFFEFALILIALLISIIHFKQVKGFIYSFKILDKKFFLYTILGLTIAVTYPFILDHFGYYVPTVKWLDFNGYQKGISNFEWVLVQNSSWHILQATINETLDYSYRLNFILFIIYNLYVFEKKELKLLFFNPLFLFFLNSPSPDLPIFVFSIILINEYFQNQKNQSFYLLISAFLVLVKPIAIILPLFFLIESIKNKRILIDKNFLGVFILMTVFFAKNIITSANPIFPLGFGNMTFLEWSSPNIMYQVSAQYGKYIPLKDIYSFEEVNVMSNYDYLRNIIFTYNLRTLVLNFIILFTVIILLLTFINRTFKKYKVLMIFLIIKTLVILFTSAQFRFLFDVLIIDILILLFILNSGKISQFLKSTSIICSIILLVIFNINGFLKNQETKIKTLSFIQPFRLDNFFKPAIYKQLKYNKEKIGNLEFNFSDKYPLIYNGDVPTLSYTSLYSHLIFYNFFPQLINEDKIKIGFKSIELDNEKKKEIEEILEYKKSE